MFHFNEKGSNVAVVFWLDFSTQSLGMLMFWYVGVIMFCDEMEAMFPKAHVHIFSTTFNHLSKRKTYSDSQFDIYKRHGFQVHLDCQHLFQQYFVFGCPSLNGTNAYNDQ